MQQKKSVCGNIIHFDIQSQFSDITEILGQRFAPQEGIEHQDMYHDPFLLGGMHAAVQRVLLAREQHQRVVVFGDYDVDGVTSTALLVHFLKKIGIQVSYRLPHRVNDGYGMKKYFMDELKKQAVDLVITVDCGTRDIEVVDYAKTLGIDVIITDHHAVPASIPQSAIAIINPKRQDCSYPFKHLCGAGVVYKLISAIGSKVFSESELQKYLQECVDIAAIGTVADCMVLTGENRRIVQDGLKQIKYSRSKGIRKLIEHKLHEDIDADIFGFHIGPRLNAAGRMDNPYTALHLILNQQESVMDTLYEIEQLNEKRKQATIKYYQDALENIDSTKNILLYHHEEIEHGIIGIIAGRITENFYKPSIVFTSHDQNFVASCRSPEYFDIVGFLQQFQALFEAFGGHKQAAGFTIKKTNFDAFQTALYRATQDFDFEKHQKTLYVDQVLTPEKIGKNILGKISDFKPFGIGNPKPVFMIENFEFQKVSYLGKGIEHITFSHPFGYKICGFGFGKYLDDIKKSKKTSLIFDISQDSYNGKSNLLLKVIDIILE